MVREIQRPRTLAVARAVTYVAAGVATLVLVGLTFGFLVLLTLVGVLSVAVFDGANGLGVVVLGVSGLLVSGLVAFALVTATRRVDHWLVETARGPDPLDTVTERYLNDELDEAGLERDIERVLGGAPSETGAGSTTPPDVDALAVDPDDPTVTIRFGDTDTTDPRLEAENR